MENRDPETMLNLCILKYLIRKKMHNTAATFAKEANVYLDAAGSKKIGQDLNQMVHLHQSSRNSSRSRENFYTNLLLSDAGVDDLSDSELLDQITAEPFCHPQNYVPLAHTDARTNREETFGLLIRNMDSNTSDLRNQITSKAPPPILSHNQMQKKRPRSLSADNSDNCLRRLVLDPARRIPNEGSKMIEQEHVGHPINQMAHLLPSLSNCSSPRNFFYTNLLTSDARLDDLSGSELMDLITAEPYYHPSNSIPPADTEARASNQQETGGLLIRNLNSNTPELRSQLTSTPSPPIFKLSSF